MTGLPETRPAGILLEAERWKLLRFVPKADVDAFAGLYAEAHRMNALAKELEAQGTPVDVDFGFMLLWLDEQLEIGASRDGWRSNQVVEVTKGAQEERHTMERYMDPEYESEAANGIKLR